MRMEGIEEHENDCQLLAVFAIKKGNLTWKCLECTTNQVRPYYLHGILICNEDIECEMQHGQTDAP